MTSYNRLYVKCTTLPQIDEVMEWFELKTGLKRSGSESDLSYPVIGTNNLLVTCWMLAADIAKGAITYDQWKQTYKGTTMFNIPESIKESATKLQVIIRPYQPYLLALAALLALDYLFFGGKGSDKIQALVKRAMIKLTSVVNAGADKLFGPEAGDDK